MNSSAPISPELSIGKRLREERRRRGWNQNELARRAGVSRTTLYHLEQGSGIEPRSQTLGRVAIALGITVDELVSQKQVPSNFTLARRFDEVTNPAVQEVMKLTPRLFQEWTEWDWDELYSTFGVGGALSAEGVQQVAERINQKRELQRRLQIVLETDLRGVAEALINSLYEQLQQKSRLRGRIPEESGS